MGLRRVLVWGRMGVGMTGLTISTQRRGGMEIGILQEEAGIQVVATDILLAEIGILQVCDDWLRFFFCL